MRASCNSWANPASSMSTLYPLAGQSQPTATYLDARRASDGREVDRAACVAALKRN